MSARTRLIVLDDREGLIAAAPGTGRLRELADVDVLDRPLAEVPDERLREVRFVLAIRERTRLDAATLERLPNLELLLQTGGHAYHVDTGAAAARGLPIALSRRAKAVRSAVPELTVLLTLACLRRLPEATRMFDGGAWSGLIGRTLAGRRFGLLGVGRHGTNVARLAAAFGADVVAWDRTGRGGDDPVPRLPLDELLATCDVVSIHLPLTDESRGLLDRSRLAGMKPRSVLVNTSRGAIVDESALVDALRSGPLAAAGIDVFVDEPLPPDHPLRSAPNAVLTPHIGWTVEEVFDEFAAIAAEQLADYLDNRLDRTELLDPGVQPRDSALGGLLPGPAA